MKFNPLLFSKRLLVFTCLLVAFITPSYAYNFSAGVFQFQQKLAAKGNAQAQYKLAYMYETGQGIKVDLDKAREWYLKAADQHYPAAKMRATYISIKKSGYQSAKHSTWLKNLRNQADDNNGEAMLLLGSLYKNGFILRKNLNQAAKFFKRASNKDIASAEAELESVNAILFTQKVKRKAREKQKNRENEKRKREQKKQQQKQQINKQKTDEERKRKQAVQRAERERLSAEKERMSIAIEKQKLFEEKQRLQEKRQALLLRQAQAERAALNSTPEAEKEVKKEPKKFNKNICKGKKARFLTICR